MSKSACISVQSGQSILCSSKYCPKSPQAVTKTLIRCFESDLDLHSFLQMLIRCINYLNLFIQFKRAAPWKRRIFRHIPQRRPRSHCASDFTHVQDDVNPHNWRMLEGSFSLYTARTHVTKTRLFKYIENFTSKNWKYSDKKNADIFHIAAQNIDCLCSLEPPRRGGSNG